MFRSLYSSAMIRRVSRAESCTSHQCAPFLNTSSHGSVSYTTSKVPSGVAAQDRVKTTFLIVSDTHGYEFPPGTKPLETVDVAIHCGDLTKASKLYEFRASVRLLKEMKAPLKLVIAGNHDVTLDTPMFQKKVREHKQPLDMDQVRKEYGDFGEARQLFEDAADAGIVFLDEGNHRFNLANRAALNVYASPFTRSIMDWGFVYRPTQEHDWHIAEGVDVVITHAPPRGILDCTASCQRAGSSNLFSAVARTRPLLHCFGHIHEGWGASLITWRNIISESPSHLTAINNERSTVVENLATLKAGTLDTPEVMAEKARKLDGNQRRRSCVASHCHDDLHPLSPRKETVFVNAAIQGLEKGAFQLPWLISIELPRSSVEG